MRDLQQAIRNMAIQFETFGARLGGYQVVKSETVPPGEILLMKDERQILIHKPTEIQRIVRLGFREAHPWFKDPLDPLRMIR